MAARSVIATRRGGGRFIRAVTLVGLIKDGRRATHRSRVRVIHTLSTSGRGPFRRLGRLGRGPTLRVVKAQGGA